MCGIAGFVSFEGHRRDEAAARVRRMTAVIAHRGPDGDGVFVDDLAALGHRRLAIIDVAGGQQPMAASDPRVHIVFNGEIYNFLEVRADLEGMGHRFRTRSDTEVILEAYLEWGERCAERLSGMFAFAIWDARSKRLLLGRDRVGKKPLYYCRQGEVVAFASELKALRAADLCPTTLDPQALDCYFTFGYVPAPRTIYAGVQKLPAASLLELSATTQRERKYWQLSFADPMARSLEATVEEFAALLDNAVSCRLMSEVPLGAFLSGGLDSSLVVSSMAKMMARPVITHSIGFENKALSELSAANETAATLGTDHHEFLVQPRAADVIEKIAWHFDEPVADSSAVPTWYVCQMARSTVTVALSGDGGDEGFGGYTFRYVPHMIESKARTVVPSALRFAVFGALGALWPASARLPRALRLKTIFENLAVSDLEAFYHDLSWLRADSRERLYTADFMQSLQGFTPLETVASYYCRTGAPDALSRGQLTDIQHYMTDDVLVKVDRMSMAHSLEVRSPLLDHRILEFAARLPPELKIRAKRSKVILRALAERRLPGGAHQRPKQGFSIPAASWLRHELRPMAQELILDRGGLLADVLNGRAVRQMWHEHQSGALDHSVPLWGLMMLSLWDETEWCPVSSPRERPVCITHE